VRVRKAFLLLLEWKGKGRLMVVSMVKGIPTLVALQRIRKTGT
jgi:hypothetical protein